MDNLLKQLRVRFSSFGKDEAYDTREGRMPARKSVSFKGDRKKTQNWFQRQISGQMSHSDYTSDGEFATSVAAAAYAINSLEEEESMKQKAFEILESPPSRTKSKREESMLKRTNSSKISRWFSGKEGKDGKSLGDISLRKSSTLDKNMMEDIIPDHKQPEKTPSLSNKYLNGTGSRRYGSGKEMQEWPTDSSNMKPLASSSLKEKYDGNSMGYNVETQADAWEKEKMDKIRKRYEKTNATILEWEDEKKTKAKHRLQRKEQGAMELEKARALQEYREELRRIDKIAGEARALANERKRNEELKILEKAKRIRETGKFPSKCFCC